MIQTAKNATRLIEPCEAFRTDQPLAERTFAEMESFFCGETNITYVFQARDHDDEEIYSAGPDPITALQLIPAALGLKEFRPPQIAAPADTIALTTRVNELVKELTRRDCEYSLFWHVLGDKNVSLATTYGEPFAAFKLEMVDAIAHDVADYLYGIAD